jgi:hypothetical protein
MKHRRSQGQKRFWFSFARFQIAVPFSNYIERRYSSSSLAVCQSRREKQFHAKAQRRKEKHSSDKQYSTAWRASFAPLRETVFSPPLALKYEWR